MSEFKVGDKVKAITDARSKFGVHKGQVYEVDAVYDGFGTLHLVGQSATTHHKFDRFELVTEPATAYKVITTMHADATPWATDFETVEAAEQAIKDYGRPSYTFEIFSVVRTVHKTVKLTKRTEVFRELTEVE